MQVPPGTKEYEEALKESRALLHRLKQGKKIINQFARDGQILKARDGLELWYQLANALFSQLELITLIHQQRLTGSSVVVNADGSLKKVEDMMDMNPEEFDPWTLYSITKLHEVFGDEYKEILTINMEQKPLN